MAQTLGKWACNQNLIHWKFIRLSTDHMIVCVHSGREQQKNTKNYLAFAWRGCSWVLSVWKGEDEIFKLKRCTSKHSPLGFVEDNWPPTVSSLPHQLCICLDCFCRSCWLCSTFGFVGIVLQTEQNGIKLKSCPFVHMVRMLLCAPASSQTWSHSPSGQEIDKEEFWLFVMQQNEEQLCCFRWRTESASFETAESGQQTCSKAGH